MYLNRENKVLDEGFICPGSPVIVETQKIQQISRRNDFDHGLNAVQEIDLNQNFCI